MRLTLILLVVLFCVVGAALALLYTPDRRRGLLEARYPGETVVAAGVALRVRDTGPRHAPAVILLHGFGSSLETWDDWAAALSDSFRVVRYDLPGFGLTGPDPTGDYGDARGVQVLGALMDRLGIAKASIVGNSMGGKLAWMFAATQPARVDRLVLVAPDGFAVPGFTYGQRPKLSFSIRLLPYVLPRPMLRASLAPAYADPAMLTDARVDRYRDMMLAPGVRGAIVARMEQYVPQEPTVLLRGIRSPTLLVWGGKDGMIPYANAQDYLQAIPGATLAAFPDLGHIPQEEAPARSLEPVRRFLSR